METLVKIIITNIINTNNIIVRADKLCLANHQELTPVMMIINIIINVNIININTIIIINISINMIKNIIININIVIWLEKNAHLHVRNPNSAKTPLGQRGGGRYQQILMMMITMMTMMMTMMMMMTLMMLTTMMIYSTGEEEADFIKY